MVANQRADELQNQMKKMCTSDFQKIVGLDKVTEKNSTLNYISYYNNTATLQKTIDTINETGNAVVGMGAGFITNIIGGNIALGYGLGKLMQGENFFEGMKEFNEKYINPVVQNVKKELANNSPAFDGGYIEGNLAATAASLISAGGTLKTAAKTINIFTTTQSISQGTLALEKVLVVSLKLEYITCTDAAQLLTSVGELSSSVMFMSNGGLDTWNGEFTRGNSTTNQTGENNNFKIIQNEDKNINNKLFNTTEKLEEHFKKHSSQIAEVLGENDYTINDYLTDANYIVENGTYTPELNGYVKFMKGDKYGFVGLDRNTGNITTFHIKSVSELMKRAPSLGFER